MVIVFAMTSISTLAQTNTKHDPMVTEEFNVDMVVGQNNVVDVTTTIKVNFNASRHGIYYYIPYQGEVFFQEGQNTYQKPYRNKIIDVKTNHKQVEVYNESGNTVIKIGEADKTVMGFQEYIIEYTYIIYDDEINEFDFFYMNFFPLDWETPIQSGTVTVTMPKEFDDSKLEFISGVYGSVDNDAVSYSVDGNKITATLERTLDKGETVTAKLILPEGYFVGENSYSYLASVMIALIIISTAIVAILWFLYGRSEEIIPVISFEPPQGMTSAEVGVIVDGNVDNKDLISLIIYWASKGYLTISQKDKSNFEFTKVRDLPSKAKKYEQTMFNGLFQTSNIVSTSSLKNTFYTTLDASRSLLSRNFSSKSEDRIYTKESVVSQAFSGILAAVPTAAFLFINIFMQIKSDAYYFLAAFLTFAVILASGFISGVHEKRNAMKKSTYRLSLIGSFLFIGIVSIGIVAFGTIILNQLIMSVVVAAITIALVCFVRVMKNRTEKSNEWMQEILGLREFIESAEVERLNMLIEENPEYFYDVLPFAYSLGLTDKWAKNFESIAVEPPQWYYGSYGGTGYFSTVLFVSSFNRCMSVTSETMSVRPAQSGGSGGGFSGGGMGGGGGGSW